MVVRVVIEPGEDGYFVVHCPTLRSCVSQGKTREETFFLYLEPEPESSEFSPGREFVDLAL